MTLLNSPQQRVVTVLVTPNMELEFSFDPSSETELSRDGDNLIFTFDHGGRVVLYGFYAQDAKALPSMGIQGAQIDAADFLSSLGDETLLPAAGPAVPNVPSPPDNGDESRAAATGSIFAWSANAEMDSLKLDVIKIAVADFADKDGVLIDLRKTVAETREGNSLNHPSVISVDYKTVLGLPAGAQIQVPAIESVPSAKTMPTAVARTGPKRSSSTSL